MGKIALLAGVAAGAAVFMNASYNKKKDTIDSVVNLKNALIIGGLFVVYKKVVK